MEQLVHPFDPVYNDKSLILVLGTMPSVQSRKERFYYGHPQNRFWKILCTLWNREPFSSIDDKKRFLLDKRIALWDVLQSCTIELSKDSSIKNPVVNNLSIIMGEAPIKAVFANGKKACELYQRFSFPSTAMEAICLPSTSPANGQYDFDRLVQEWSLIKSSLEEHTSH